MQTDIMHIALNCKRIPHIEVAYTSCLISSLNISVGKTPVFSSSVPFAYLSAGGKLYYNNSLSLNGNIDLISISL